MVSLASIISVSAKTKIRILTALLFFAVHGFTDVSIGQEAAKTAGKTEASATTEEQAVVGETAIETDSIFSRAWRGGFVVFMVLLTLIIMSVVTWAVVITKFMYLNRTDKACQEFTKTFWDSRSLNELNGKLGDYQYSPIREVFRSGYAELIKANQLRDQASSSTLAFNAAIENLTRALQKAKNLERHKLEKYLSVLAISASAAPFIGLFGTVWGIMGAFEGIARSGSASLAAVAPGISEALIATAFGLAAAIPAVIGYNIAANKIRTVLSNVDGFSADFLNIVERYLVAEKPRGGAHASTSAPIAERL